MGISFPYDVDAGVLKKVILADGVVVTVKGARSVSLRHPIDLPLPPKRTRNVFASDLKAMAKYLRHISRSQDAPILSLCIVARIHLLSHHLHVSNNELKLKRLAPDLLKLSSTSKREEIQSRRIF